MKIKKILIMILIIFLSGCGENNYVLYKENSFKTSATQKPYIIKGKVYYPKNVPLGWTQRGIASWYGPNFHGKLTSNGEVYNMYAFTAAHKTLPMNTIVKVTNLLNHKSVIVRINDRGPFVKGRIIDLSYAAGKKIGLDVLGTAPVELKVIGFKGKRYVGGYMIQLGAFMNKKSAQRVANKYKKFGYNTIVLKKGYFYKAYIQGFKTYDEAKKFKLAHHLAGFIIGEDND